MHLGNIKLSGSRIASFLITVLAGWLLFTHISSMWIAYGILIHLIKSVLP